MATTDKDFVVRQGIRVATGVTFSDGTVQTTASYSPVIDGGAPSSIYNTAGIDGGLPSTTF